MANKPTSYLQKNVHFKVLTASSTLFDLGENVI